MADKDSQSQNAFFKLVGNIKQRASDWNAMRKERKQAAKEVKAKIEETKEAEMDEEQREQELSKHQRRLDELQPGRAKLKKFTGAAGVAAVGVGAWLASKFKRNKQPSYHEVDSATAWQLNLFILFAALFHYIVLIQDFTIGEKLIFNIIFAIIVYFLFVPID